MRTLKYPERNRATSLKEKGEMVGRVVLPPPPVEPVGPPPNQEGRAHQQIDEVSVRRSLFDQS